MLLIFFLIAVYIIFAAEPLEAGAHKGCMDKDNTAFFRGVACLIIILLHVSQIVQLQEAKPLGFPYSFFINYGAMPTCFFFFCSGYGLIYSLMHKPGYTVGFLKKHVFRLFIPLLLASAVIIPIKAVGEGFLKNVLFNCLQLLRGLTPVQYTWYVYALLYFYFCFWLICRFTQKPVIAAPVLCLSTLAYNYLCRRFFAGAGLVHWTSSTFAFPMGVLFALIKEKSEAVLLKYYRVALLGAAALLLLAGVLKREAAGAYAYEVTFCAVMLFILLINMKFDFSSDKKLFRFLSGISYEMYIVQELPVLLLVNPWIYVRNGCVLGFGVLLLSVVFACLIRRGSEYLYKLFD